MNALYYVLSMSELNVKLTCVLCYAALTKQYELEMGTGRAARGPARAGPGLKIQARGPYGPKRA